MIVAETGVIAADTDPEHDPANQQEGVIWRERRRDRAGGEDEHLISVDPFAAEHVGDTAEDDRAKRRRQQRGRVQPRHLAGRQGPLRLEQRTTMPMTNRS
jgi:hypothetical protein